MADMKCKINQIERPTANGNTSLSDKIQQITRIQLRRSTDNFKKKIETKKNVGKMIPYTEMVNSYSYSYRVGWLVQTKAIYSQLNSCPV